MRLAIFSDIHGNREALVAILADAQQSGIDETICLGDTIGIGPNPRECLDLIIDNNVAMVLGNHELYSLNGITVNKHKGPKEVEHHNWIAEQLTHEQKQFLRQLSFTLERTYNDKSILFAHFLIRDSRASFPFYNLSMVDDGSICDVVNTLPHQLIFVGHKHAAYCLQDKLYGLNTSGCRHDDFTEYVVLDTDALVVESKTVQYDRAKFERALRAQDYPERNAIAKSFFDITL